MAIVYWCKPIYNQRSASRLCSRRPISNTSTAKNRELMIQPAEAVVIPLDNITKATEAVANATTMAASMATEAAEDNTTTTEVTPEAPAAEAAADTEETSASNEILQNNKRTNEQRVIKIL
jgi:hypothetical protein